MSSNSSSSTSSSVLTRAGLWLTQSLAAQSAVLRNPCVYASAGGRCITPSRNSDFSRKLLDTSWHNPVAQAPGTAGLNVGVYHYGAQTLGPVVPTYASVHSALQAAASQTPTYSFVSSNAPNTQQGISLSQGGDTLATQTFLGSYAAGAGAQDAAALQSSALDWHGSINFPTTGTYTFNLATADDAAAIFLGGNGTPGSGTLVAEKNFDGSIASAPGLPNPLHIDIFPVSGVQQTGWYPFELFYYNQYAGGNGGAGLQWQVTGPAPVAFSTYQSTATTPFAGPNPLHQYAFNDAGTQVVDSAPADQRNGVLVGGASLNGGNLVTQGSSHTQAAQLTSDGMSFFTGSFSVGHWFTLADHAPGFQTLFCFATDTQNYFVGHPQRGNDGRLSVEFASRGVTTLLRAPLPALGSPVKLFVTYEGTTQQAKLYVNDALMDTQTLPTAFNLAATAANYRNIGGVSPWGDPSLSGTTNQFNIYREAVGLEQMAETSPVA